MSIVVKAIWSFISLFAAVVAHSLAAAGWIRERSVPAAARQFQEPAAP